MNDEQTKTVSPRRLKRVAGGVALLAGGAIAGGVLASTLTASAADNSAGTPPPADGAVHGFEHPGGPRRYGATKPSSPEAARPPLAPRRSRPSPAARSTESRPTPVTRRTKST